MIVYACFSVSLHRLELRSMEELEALRLRLDEVVRAAGLSTIDFETDIEVEVLEHAGKPEEGASE